MANEALKAKVEEWHAALADYKVREAAMHLQLYNSDETSAKLTVTPEIRKATVALAHHSGNGWAPVVTQLRYLKEDLAKEGDVSKQYDNVVTALDSFADRMRIPLQKFEESMSQFSGRELEDNNRVLTTLKGAVAEAREAAKELKKLPPEAEITL